MWNSLIIENTIIIVVVTILLLFVRYIVKKRRGNVEVLTNKEKFEVFVKCMFVGYICAVLCITLFRTDGAYERFAINLKPFKGVEKILSTYTISETLGIEIDFFVGNVLLFVPFGCLIPIVYKKINTYIKVSMTTIASILVIEATQFFIGVGSFDIDDVIYNFTGAILGYGVYLIVNAIFIEKKNRLKNIILGCIPYMIIMCLIVGIKVAYNTSKYGILPFQYIYKSGIKVEDIKCNIELDDEEKEEYVYLEAEPGGLKSVTKLFGEGIEEKVFSLVGKDYVIDEEDTKECRCFITKDKAYTLEYGQFGFCEGLFFQNELLNQEYEDKEETDGGFEQVDKLVVRRNIDTLRKFMNELGMSIPDNIKYMITESYPDVDLQLDNGINADGMKEYISINGKFTKDGELISVGVYIDTYKKTDDRIRVISEKELINRIKKGQMPITISTENTIQAIELKWKQSSKGYFFPIYVVSTTGLDVNREGIEWSYYEYQAWEFK